jgi:hypothetical protein
MEARLDHVALPWTMAEEGSLKSPEDTMAKFAISALVGSLLSIPILGIGAPIATIASIVIAVAVARQLNLLE